MSQIWGVELAIGASAGVQVRGSASTVHLTQVVLIPLPGTVTNAFADFTCLIYATTGDQKIVLASLASARPQASINLQFALPSKVQLSAEALGAGASSSSGYKVHFSGFTTSGSAAAASTASAPSPKASPKASPAAAPQQPQAAKRKNDEVAKPDNKKQKTEAKKQPEPEEEDEDEDGEDDEELDFEDMEDFEDEEGEDDEEDEEEEEEEEKPQPKKQQQQDKAKAAEQQKKQQQQQQQQKEKEKAAAAAKEKEKAASKPSTPSKPEKLPVMTLKNGLKLQDTKIGVGKEAADRSAVSIRYRGSLLNGKVFDSNMPRGQPLRFKIGAGDVIAGFEQGTKGMKVGGTRTVVIPPHLGYGPRGAPPDIPGNATLIFDLELVSTK